jgi:GH24 family phage-related lysozyme (muramidase)
MMGSAEAAKSVPFYQRGTDTAAKPEEIAADYDAVKKVFAGDSNAKLDTYKSKTKLEIKETDANALMVDVLAAKESELLGKMPDLHDLPPEAQKVILDMVYNMGVDRLYKPATERGFPKFLEAVKARDWKTAAGETKSGDVGGVRNDWRKKTMEKAIPPAPAETKAAQ